jgi:ribokinase
MSGNLLVIGSSNIDQIIFSENLPRPGQTVSKGRYDQVFGGKGANQAVAAAKAGVDVTMITSVGDDSFGDGIRHNLEQYGINSSFVQKQPGVHTGVAMIMVDQAGENCISVALGANDLLKIDDVKLAIDEFRLQFNMAILQMEAPLETVIECINFLKERNIPVMLNLAPFYPLPLETLQKVTYLILNNTEAEALSFFPVSNLSSADQASKAIFYQTNIPNILITLGSLGVYLRQGSETHFIPAYEVEVVDTTAAGDVFCGYLGAGLALDLEIYEALKLAVAASALCVTKQGAQPSIPEREEVILFLANH